MARDRLSSDYSENMSDATTCSCLVSSVDKCSVRSCSGAGGSTSASSMFQEPFFLHPPGSRPRDGLYINPMIPGGISPSSSIRQQKDSIASATESFYLHSPHELVYNPITQLFENQRSTIVCSSNSCSSSSSSRSSSHRKDDPTVTVKVDVHHVVINNGTLKQPQQQVTVNGSASPESQAKDAASINSSEHAYEQICMDDPNYAKIGPPTPTNNGNGVTDNPANSDSASRSRKSDRRYSKSSSTTSESSNLSSEVHYSSATSTPSLSRASSNERTKCKSPKISETTVAEKKNSPTTSIAGRSESEKDTKSPITGHCTSIFRPPPPPPPPPPEIEEVVIVTSKVVETIKEDANEDTQEDKFCEATTTLAACSVSAAADSTTTAAATQEEEDPEVQLVSQPAASEEVAQHHQQHQSVTSHLVNRHMVLPFIPPKFVQAADSETLLKPSEYLRSICKANGTNNPALPPHHPPVPHPAGYNTLSKARSVDNLDIQGRGVDEEDSRRGEREEENAAFGPPPPPLPPPPGAANLASSTNDLTGDSSTRSSQQQQQQPLATISIQDLTSVQLRRTNLKMHATKTFSAPPNRSVSMTNVSETFFVQKTDLIAELKKTKDIPGIKKLKVQRAQVEKTQEQTLISEISKTFSISNFVDQIPEKDSSGNVIPIWKRQMLARKAAERAKKELEEQIARENEEKRQKAIPPWKRMLLAKKDSEAKVSSSVHPPLTASISAPKLEVPKKEPPEPSPPIAAPPPEEAKSTQPEEKKPEPVNTDDKNNNNSCNNNNNNNNDDDDDDSNVHIIPWRAQLRKTNSKLNILD